MNDEARAVWRRLADDLGLDERLSSEALPCFRVRETRPWSSEDPLGTSRLAGPPDLPAELEWPVVDGIRLELVAQIDLSALRPRILEDLPDRGWLWLFVGKDEPAHDIVHRVLFWDGPRERLRRASPPKGRAPRWAARATRPQHVRLEAAMTLEARDDADDSEGKESELARAIDDAVERAPSDLSTESSTRVGGHAVTFDGDARQDAHLIRSGRAALLHQTHLEDSDLATEIRDAWAAMDDERATELEQAREQLAEWRAERVTHRAAIARWRPLLVIASAPEVEHLWWDEGLLEVLIDERDLASRTFDRTYCAIHST